MSYVPPNNWINGDILDATELKANNDAARKHVNQDIVGAELGNESFDYDSLQVGEFEPIASSHRFVTGEVKGLHNDIQGINRSYFTSHIKPGQQTDLNAKAWHPIAECGHFVTIDQSADLLINFGATFACGENGRIVAYPRRYPSKIQMRYYDGSQWFDIGGTRAFAYEEHYNTVTATASTADGPSKMLDNVNGYASDQGVEKNFRRWVGWCWHVQNLPPGDYVFGVFVNAGVEEGFSSARNFTIETFYH